MGIFRQFPYTNFHDLNLDWLLENMKTLLNDWASYQEKWNVLYNDITTAFDDFKATFDEHIAKYDADFQAFINSINVESELQKVFNRAIQDGTLNRIVDPVVIRTTTQWLSENITTPETVVIDRSLSIPNACADAEAVGYQIYNQLGIKANSKSVLGAYEFGYYKASDSGIKAPAENYLLYDMIPIRPNTTYYLGITSNTHICFLDDFGRYISGKLTANMTNEDIPIHIDSLVFTTPSTARYCAISVNRAYKIEVYPYKEPSVIDSKLSNSVVKNLPRLFLEDINNLPQQIKKISNKNLFNKNVVIEGYFCSEGSGRLINAEGFGVAYIPIEAGKTYTTVGFINNHWAIVNSAGVRIAGGVVPADTTITAPSGSAYLGVSVQLNNIDNMAICEGSNAVYSDFGSGDVYKITSGNILEVGENQTYATITDAVNDSIDGDIILVHNGVYTESVSAINKNIIIIGSDKYNCILQYTNSDYDNPPIKLSSGMIANMTIRCTEGVGSNKAYCVHLDNIGLQNKSMLFKDVIFYNASKPCVGIGLRGGCTVEFNNCEFRTENESAFYCHDWDSASASGVEQFIKLINCSLINNSATSPTIQLQSQEIEGSSIGIRFQRNIVANVNANGSKIGMRLWNPSIGGGGYLDSSRWYLAIGSEFNSDPLMNRN